MNMKLRTSKRQNGPGAVGILLACLAGYAPNAFSQAVSPDIRRDATVLAVEKVMPCVVNIATETIVRVRDPFDEFFRHDQVVEVDAPGLTSPMLHHFHWKHLPRPVIPLDANVTWSPPTLP